MQNSLNFFHSSFFSNDHLVFDLTFLCRRALARGNPTSKNQCQRTKKPVKNVAPHSLSSQETTNLKTALLAGSV